MALTPEDIEQHIFKVSRRGYDKVEVDRFLGEVAKSYRDLQQQVHGAVLVTPGPSTAPGAAPEAPDAEDTGRSPLLPRRAPGATAPGGGELFSFDQRPEPAGTPGEADDFQRLGTEVATVLRTAHASV